MLLAKTIYPVFFFLDVCLQNAQANVGHARKVLARRLDLAPDDQRHAQRDQDAHEGDDDARKECHLEGGVRGVDAELVLGVNLLGVSWKSAHARKTKAVFKGQVESLEDLKGLVVEHAICEGFAFVDQGTVVLEGRQDAVSVHIQVAAGLSIKKDVWSKMLEMLGRVKRATSPESSWPRGRC